MQLNNLKRTLILVWADSGVKLVYKWCRNGVKHLSETLKAPEIKGDVDKYEIRNRGASQRRKVYPF